MFTSEHKDSLLSTSVHDSEVSEPMFHLQSALAEDNEEAFFDRLSLPSS